jgi:serine protease Do
MAQSGEEACGDVESKEPSLMPRVPTLPCSPSRPLAVGILLLAVGAASGADDVTEAIRHARALSKAFRSAAEANVPAVVTLIAKTKPRPGAERDQWRELLKDPRFRQLLPDGVLPKEAPDDDEEPDEEEDSEEPDLPGIPIQIGSGVVIDPKGVILTNNHVVADAEELLVRFGDGQEYPAKQIKTDPSSDLAIVRVEAGRSLPAARLGDSSKLAIGDWVIAIGSPFDLEATVSAGIISGMGRDVRKVKRGRLVQTDAAINPGNSGGPLVNLEGEVVGINTAIASLSGGYQGVGFAIPSNRAQWVARELATHGVVRRAGLGILIDELSPAAAKKLRLQPRSGVYVKDVIAGGPAEAAGVRVNDVVTEFAGERVRGPRDLQDAVEQKPIDAAYPLKAMRDGKEITLQVILKALR